MVLKEPPVKTTIEEKLDKYIQNQKRYMELYEEGEQVIKPNDCYKRRCARAYILREKLGRIVDYKANNKLTPRQKMVFMYRYGIGESSGIIYTLLKISKKLKITRERVRQIEYNAIMKINTILNENPKY